MDCCNGVILSITRQSAYTQTKERVQPTLPTKSTIQRSLAYHKLHIFARGFLIKPHFKGKNPNLQKFMTKNLKEGVDRRPPSMYNSKGRQR